MKTIRIHGKNYHELKIEDLDLQLFLNTATKEKEYCQKCSFVRKIYNKFKLKWFFNKL
jgi:hypothetical protein